MIITTTTHMAYEPSKPFALHGDASAVREALSSQGMVIAAEYDFSTGKISSLSSQKLKELTGYGAVLLIEADGARRMPVKIPKDWEPVIPDFVQLVIGVIGLDCLDEPIFKTAYSAENLAFFLDKTELDSITSTDLLKLQFQKVVSEKMYKIANFVYTLIKQTFLTKLPGQKNL